jgi:hypothetical protein
MIQSIAVVCKRMKRMLAPFQGFYGTRHAVSARGRYPVNKVCVCLIVLGFILPASGAAAAELFSAAVNYAAGDSPKSLCTGDFDGDGHIDLAVGNYWVKRVSILMGSGDGTFAFAGDNVVGSGPNCICSGDFNEDGDIDLAVTNSLANSVSVLLNEGDGTFAPSVFYAATDGPCSVCTGDFDEDGHLDLAIANNGLDFNVYVVAVLLGAGDGTFAPAVNYTPGKVPRSVCTGDFNEDGHADLAVANGGTTSGVNDNVSILLGVGDGTFSAASKYGVGDSPFTVCTGDFYEDGHLDLATSNYHSDDVSVILGAGDGSFGTPASLGAGEKPYSVCSGDFDLDGHLDLAVTNINSDDLYVLLGSGDGAFGTVEAYGAGDGACWVRAGDFDEDGRIDLAVANIYSDNVSIFINVTEGPVATMLESFECSNAGGGIEIQWRLSLAGSSVEFSVYRESAGSGVFLPQAEDIALMEALSYRFIDTACEPGESYRYRVDVSDEGGTHLLFMTNIMEIPAARLTLGQNYPNPFNPITVIRYSIPGSAHVVLDIFDLSGRLVDRLVDSAQKPGSHSVEWTGCNGSGEPVSSGVYFYRLSAGKMCLTKRMVLLR